MRTPPPR
jgi:hypothetical protein